MIKFYCPNCNQKLGVPDEYVGRRIRCNKCNEATVVPKPVAEAKPSAAAASATEPISNRVAAPKTSAPAPRPVAPAPKPQPAPVAPRKPGPEMVDLELIADNGLPPQDPNLEAIQQASRQRASKITVSRPAGKSSSNSGRRSVGATELAKGMGKIPLSLATSFACMAAVIVLWVIIAKISGFVIGLIVIFVPVAGAWGLTRFTEHRGIMLGLLAAILGFAGMTLGHVAVAKWVVLPMLEEDKDYNSTRDDFQKTITKSLTTLPSEPNRVQAMADDDEIMFNVAGWDLVQTGKMDKETYNQVYRCNELDQEFPEDVQKTIDTASEQIDKHLESWDDNQRLAALKKHYNSMQQQNNQESIEKITTVGASAITFVIAFVASFSLLDLVWYPMGLWGAFKLAAAIGGEE
jgi:hypothetical protein